MKKKKYVDYGTMGTPIWRVLRTRLVLEHCLIDAADPQAAIKAASAIKVPNTHRSERDQVLLWPSSNEWNEIDNALIDRRDLSHVRSARPEAIRVEVYDMDARVEVPVVGGKALDPVPLTPAQRRRYRRGC